MKVGKVYLVGAGPGDYGLLTLKGLACIRQADVIIYDRLANKAYLEETKAGCEHIYVGKASANHTKTQDEINDLLVQKAKAGKCVTRLKGGDPYVFGRGGEEALYLKAHDVPFEVVPGVTSAIGGLCYAGIPITQRGMAASFHVITGHLKEDATTAINWQALAALEGTLVFLMGVSSLEAICEQLIQQGKAHTTPVAVVHWATRPNQKVAVGTLETIRQAVKTAGITSPSLIVVGEVVTLRETLNFFEEKPLFGKRIITTRARAQASVLAGRLEALGAEVITVPTIRVMPIQANAHLDQAIAQLTKYTYILFTSQNAVYPFFEALQSHQKDSRALAHVQIIAIGEATKQALRQYGIVADAMPERFVAESVCALLEPKLHQGDCILMPKASETRDVIAKRLGAVCTVEEVVVYENTIAGDSQDVLREALQEGGIDYITFTSASTVKNFMSLIGESEKAMLRDIACVAIGPITGEAMRQAGLHVALEAEAYTIDGMIRCLLKKEGRIDEK